MKQKFAVPLKGAILSSHFGHCDQFAIIDTEQKKIVGETLKTPPPHEPGLLPKWLSQMGVTHIISGGMGERAVNLFKERGIGVSVGAPLIGARELVESYLNNSLENGENCCDH
ncbi:MAG: NifB/NifX family molybdenum-iron cluster-binding protein [Bacteroidales bacterium]